LTIAGFVLWLFSIYKTWLGDRWEVPVFADWAKKLLGNKQH
jgi:uncharacterized membrane protein